MKKFTTIIFVCLTFLAFADGGDDTNQREYINEYEVNLNLQYISIYDTVSYTYNVEKEKKREVFVTSDIAVYNIAKDSISYIFKGQNIGTITDFIYETQYYEQKNTVLFNGNYDPNWESNNSIYLYEKSNNVNVPKRPISNNIIIVTKDLSFENTSIWLVDKYGKNLQKKIEINSDWNWEIDVKNQQIRCTRQVGKTIEIKNIPY
jgi:hypothetical protein